MAEDSTYLGELITNDRQTNRIVDYYKRGADLIFTVMTKKRQDEADSASGRAGPSGGVLRQRLFRTNEPDERYEKFLTLPSPQGGSPWGPYVDPEGAEAARQADTNLYWAQLQNISHAYSKFQNELNAGNITGRIDRTRETQLTRPELTEEVKNWIIEGRMIRGLLTPTAQSIQLAIQEDAVNETEIPFLGDAPGSAASTADEVAFVAGDDPTAEAAFEDFEKVTEDSNAFINTEQQFLIKNLGSFAIHNQGIGGAKNYINIFGDPQDTVTKFVSKPNVEPLLRIRPDQYALIVPKMKLYKVLDNPKGDEKKEKEFLFKTFTDRDVIKKMMDESLGRGDAAGITNITIEYEGTNLFASRRELAVSIRLHFQSFDNLFDAKTMSNIQNTGTPSSSDPKEPPSYADLIWRTTKTTKSKEGEKQGNPNHFRIKLVVGWSVPPKTATELIDTKLRTAIEETSKAIYLDMVDHDFSFNQDGTVDLQIKYRGYIEEALRGSKSDILLDTNLAQKLKKIDETLTELEDKEVAAGDPAEKNAKQIQQLQDRREEIVVSSKTERYSRILRNMLSGRYLYFVDCLWWDIKGVRKTSKISHHKDATYISSKASVHKKLLDAVDHASAADLSKEIAKIGDSNAPWYSSADFDKDCASYRLRYFYFGDLLDVVLDMVKENYSSEFENIQFLSASFVHRHGFGKKELVPLASIPVSMNFFSDWMIKHVIARQRPVYFLLKFIKDFIEEALIKPLNTNLKSKDMGDKNYATQLSYKTFSLPRLGEDADPLRSSSGSPGAASSEVQALTQARLTKALWPKGPDGPTAMARHVDVPLKHGSVHYVLIYPYTYDLTPRTGNYKKDFEDGIYHLGIGHNSGIVKEIKFDKQLIPGQAEAQFTEHDRAIGQMRRHYNASVTTVGNTLFAPGQPIYLDPLIPGLGSPSRKGSVLRLFGLGGYYVVQKVALELSSDDFITTLTCMWEAAGDGSGKAKRFGGTRAGAVRRMAP